jgi:hypothetical protein
MLGTRPAAFFGTPSTFFFVISYVEVLNWCLTLATYENAWG